MTANVITYRGRSAAREVGKVAVARAGAGRSAGQGDEPLRVGRSEGDARSQPARGRPRRAATPTIQLFGQLWQRIQDLPRHLGQHSGGMVICQGRLDDVVPLENASMPDRVVVQWDKDDCADMGLVKVDLLGLGMMAVLQDALDTGEYTRRGSGFGARGSGTEIGIGIDPDAADPQGPICGPAEPRTRRARTPEPAIPTSAPSISPTCPPTIRRSTGCCRRPTRSGSSRSNRARRWRRCRGCGRSASTTSSSKSRSSGRDRSSGRWCIRI